MYTTVTTNIQKFLAKRSGWIIDSAIVFISVSKYDPLAEVVTSNYQTN